MENSSIPEASGSLREAGTVNGGKRVVVLYPCHLQCILIAFKLYKVVYLCSCAPCFSRNTPSLIVLKTSGERREPAGTAAQLLVLVAPAAATLVRAPSCLKWLQGTSDLARLQVVSVGTRIEEEIGVTAPGRMAFETLVLCLLQGCSCPRYRSFLYLSRR